MATEGISLDRVPSLVQNRRTMAMALLWGGVMVGLAALWVKNKHEEINFVVPLLQLVIALAAVGLAILRLRIPADVVTQPTGESVARLEQQKRVVGLFLIGAGLLLLILAAWLGFTEKLNALGESLGLGLLALLGIATGVVQSAREPMTAESLFQSLLGKKGGLGLALVVAGAALVGVGLWLRFKVLTDNPGGTFPRWLGPVLLGLVILAGGMFLRMATALTPASMRLFVLAVGGLSGLLIAFFTFCQAWIWRDQVFFAGVADWNGPMGWRVWVCGYIEIIGLGLLFGSLLLARADARVNPLLRRTLYGYNAVLTGLLMLTFLVTLNIVVFAAYPTSYDWSGSGLHGLSDRSVDLLQKLKEPVTAYLIMSDGYPIFKDMRRFLENCQGITSLLTVKIIEPDNPRDFKAYEDLVQTYPEVAPTETRTRQESPGRGVFLVYGTGKDAKRTLLPPEKLQETRQDFQEKTRKVTYYFKGEDAFMSNLQYFMVGQKKTKVYFLQGNGELDITNSSGERRPRIFHQELSPLGAGILVERLESENIEVKGLSFAAPSKDKEKEDPRIVHVGGDKGKKEVPKDCEVLVVAGPSKKMARETLDALTQYMDRGGRMLVLFDVVVADAEYSGMLETGLEKVVEKFGVEVGSEYFFRFGPDFREYPLATLASTPIDVENPVSKKFAGKLFPVVTTRIVRAKKGPAASRDVTPVILAIGDPDEYAIWPETDVRAIRDIPSMRKHGEATFADKAFARNLPVAVAVQEEGKPRLVVFGDAEMASNFYQRTLNADIYFNLLGSFLDWVTDRPGIGIRPREHGHFILTPNIAQEWGRITLLPGWLMTIAVVGLGLGTWVVRRK